MASLDSKIEEIRDKVSDMSDTVHKIDKEVALQKAAFEDHMKQDELMYQEFKRMNDILQQNTESLKEHMHRTNLLEDVVQKMDQRLSPLEIKHIKESAIKEWIKDNAIMVAKIAGAATAVIGLLALLKPYIVLFLKS